jgi:hypothetical protein
MRNPTFETTGKLLGQFLGMCGAEQRGKVAAASTCVAARGVRGRAVVIFA